jgi:hypothetical protein
MSMKAAIILSSLFLLAACGETRQDKAGVGSDKPAVTGTGVAVYTDPGWTAGDKASWANHLKARATYGQNDHARAPK